MQSIDGGNKKVALDNDKRFGVEGIEFYARVPRARLQLIHALGPRPRPFPHWAIPPLRPDLCLLARIEDRAVRLIDELGVQ